MKKNEYKDLLELPCKIVAYTTLTQNWLFQIVFRDGESFIKTIYFNDEETADEFLEKIKGEKHE